MKKIFFLIGVFYNLFYSTVSAQQCYRDQARIASEALKIYVQSKDICRNLKAGAIAIDKTRSLFFDDAKVCSTARIIEFSISAEVVCATSDRAVIHASETAKATFALSMTRECQITNFEISGMNSFTEKLARTYNAEQKLRTEVQRWITPNCKTAFGGL